MFPEYAPALVEHSVKLEKLQQLERGTLIRINNEEYVKDTKTNLKQLTWFSLVSNEEYSDEQIVRLIEKYL